MSHQGNLIVVSGPSGAGKGTLVARLLRRRPEIWLSVSATTRPPRPGEADGADYFFLSPDEFLRIAENDGFLEWAEVHGNRYGTPRDKVEEHLAAGEHVLLEIDVQGALLVKEKMPGAKLVFIVPPSLEALEERLRGRGTDSEDAIATRMANARIELSRKMEYDTTVVNDDLERATDQLVCYVDALDAKEA